MTPSDLPLVLLTGADPLQGLVAARSLGRAGYPVELGSVDRTRNARSRYVGRSSLHPDPLLGRDDFVAWVNRRVDQARVDVVLPIDDVTTYALAAAAEQGALDPRVTLAAPAKHLLDDSLDKEVLARHLVAAGLRTPIAVQVDDVLAAVRFAESHGPVVVKSVAALSSAGDGSIVQGGRVARCADTAATREAAGAILAYEGRVLVQELVGGPEYGIGGVRGSAGELPLFVQRKVRGWPPRGGPPAVARSVAPDPEIVGVVRRLLEHLRWVGAAQLDLIVGPEGPVIIDLNARPWYSIGLAVASGIDVPVLAVRAARGEPIPWSIDYSAGLVWVSAEPELRHLVCLIGGWRGVRQPGEGLVGSLNRWRLEVASPRVIEPLDRDDPVPALGRLALELPSTLIHNQRERRRRRSSGLEVVEVAAIGPHAREWDELAAAALVPSPFLRSWWIDAAVGSNPRILLAFDREELVGGLALEEHPHDGARWLTVAGSDLAPDHVDVLAVPQRVGEVFDTLRGWFRDSGACVVDLGGIVSTSRLGEVLPRPVLRNQHAEAPWCELPEDFEEYWSARPSTLRHTVERASRRLERDGVVYDVLPPADAERGMSEFMALHELRWDSRSSLSGVEERFERVVGAGIATGELVVHRLIAEGRSIALEIWFERDRVASFYQSARDPGRRWLSAGSVLKARVIEAACARGAQEIDLLRGAEPYKSDWADRMRPLLRLRSMRGVTGYAAGARRLAQTHLSGWRARLGDQ